MRQFRIQWFSWVGGLMLAACLAMVVYQVQSGSQLTEPGPKEKVQAAALVAAGSRPESPAGGLLSGNGIVEPRGRETRVGSPAAGLIVRVAVQEGAQVRAGDVLVELDAKLERAALEIATAEVTAAARDLAKAQAGERLELVDATKRDAEAALGKSRQSDATLVRLENLAEQKLATQDELERSRHQAMQDRALYQAAMARRAALVNGPRTEDVAIAEARLATAKAKAQEKQTQVANRRVLAPHAGTVLQIKYRAGESVTPGIGDPLLLLGDLTATRVRADIDERDFSRLRLGAKAYVTADAFPGVRFAGEVVEIGKRIGRKNIRSDDPKERVDTKILETVIELEDPGRLLPGLRVMAFIAGVDAQ